MIKNIKAIFFDIDGTLVPFGTHNIPDEVKNPSIRFYISLRSVVGSG